MYDERWPIRTYLPNFPPPKFVFAEEGFNARRGQALDSIVCQGSIISGGTVERSILGTNTRVNSFAHVQDSILLDGVDIGRHAQRAPRDHRQGRAAFRRARRSASIPSTIGPAASRSATGAWW